MTGARDGRRLLPLAAVAAAAIGAYANTLSNGFALDDVYIVQNNARVAAGGLADLWLTPWWPTHGRELGLYRPLPIFAFALEWRIGGGDPWAFHAANVVLHAGVSVLAALLLRTLVPAGAALLGALVFALHPLHVEAVANVVGQAELIAAAAAFGACLLHARRPALRPGPLRASGIALLYLLALLSKESAVVLPGLLVLWDLAQRRVPPTRRGAFDYLRAVGPLVLVLLAVAAGWAALRVHVLGAFAGNAAPWLPFMAEPATRLLTALRAWPEYVRLLFVPLRLSADYSPGVILPVESITPMAALGALLLAATLLLAAAAPWRPVLGMPAAWFLLALLPTSNLIVPVGVILAERTLYLPSFAVAILAAHAWRGAHAAPRAGPDHEVASRPHATAAVGTTPRRRLIAVAAAAALLLPLAARTVTRNPAWRSTEAVTESLLRDFPESYRAQWSAGAWRLQRADTAAALDHWELAYRLWPHDPEFLVRYAQLNLDVGRHDRAVAALRTAARTHLDAGGAHRLLASALLQDGRPAEALRAAREATRAQGPRWQTLLLEVQALAALGRHPEAVDAARAALAAPDGDGWYQRAFLARALAAAGHLDEALAQRDSAVARASTPAERQSALRALDDLVH